MDFCLKAKHLKVLFYFCFSVVFAKLSLLLNFTASIARCKTNEIEEIANLLAMTLMFRELVEQLS
jgi:hypothetical protein